jgi:hypothetical protein
VHHALGEKVSRERVSIEIDSIMSSASPIHAMGLITELSLFPVVFRLPVDDQYIGDVRPPPDFPRAALGCLINLDKICRHRSAALRRSVAHAGAHHHANHHHGCPTMAAMTSRIARYAALLAPVANVSVMCDDGRRARRKPAALSQHILRSELRMSTKDVSSVLDIHQASLEFKALVHLGGTSKATTGNPSNDESPVAANPTQRLAIARVLRSCGPLWRAALQTALVTELSPAEAADTYARGLDHGDESMTQECRVFVDAYAAFERTIEEMGLEGVWDLKPLIDGRRLVSLLPNLPRGPLYRNIMDDQIEHMIKHPGISVEALEDWVRTMYKQYL